MSDEEIRHCDTYIHDHKAPMCLRWFLYYHRLPAIDRALCEQNGVKEPLLFAKYGVSTVRVTMASRLGDVGIHRDPTSTRYSTRVSVSELTEFSASPLMPTLTRKCHCILRHPTSNRERRDLQHSLEYFRNIGDKEGIDRTIRQLTTICTTIQETGEPK